MRKFLLASHGSFASGALSSCEMILGKQENVFCLDAYAGENTSIQDQLQQIVDQLPPNDELVIFTDLIGGSVTNQVLQIARRENVFVIAGFNLPLLLDILLAGTDTPVREVIDTGIGNARDQIVCVNDLITLN
jgi:fructoselysine/glucoselysine PTS system EIIA component